MIGLGLCPFAAPVLHAGRLRICVSAARTPAEVLLDLRRELLALAAAAPAACETTLLVHPWVLADFLDFNDFLDDCDAVLREEDLEGTVQIASFHPDYRFADSAADDIENHTNRSPYPTLHLLRESSIERVVDSGADTDAIYRNNLETLRRLGIDGWRKLWID